MIYKNVNGTQKLVTNIRKPKKWRRFEYLESTSAGTYIDIDYNISSSNFNKIKLYMDFTATQNNVGNRWWSNGLGGSGSELVLYVGIGGGVSGTNVPFTYGNGTQDVKTSVNGDLGTRYMYTLDMYNKTYVVKNTSGSTLVNLSNFTINTPNKTQSPTIFAWKRGNTGVIGSTFSAKVYSYKLWDDNQLVRNYVPAQYNGQYGMWDLVEDKFYGNKGTGTFTVGPEIPNYEEIEKIMLPNTLLPNGVKLYDYIESTGTQWIDTGVYGYMNHTYEIDFQQTTTGNYRTWGVFGQSSYIGYNMSFTYGSSIGWIVRWENTSNSQRFISVATIDTNRHILKIQNGEVYFDGISKGTSAGHNFNFSINYNLYLFTINPANTTPTTNNKVKVFSYKDIDENGNLVRNMLPCTYFGEPGMWDTVTKQFYRNQGTGQFTLGDKIELKQFEYLESVDNQYIDTGIKVGSSTNVEGYYQLTQTPGGSYYQRLFGARSGSKNKAYVLSFCNGGVNKLYFDLTYVTSDITGHGNTNPHLIKVQNGLITIDSEIIASGQPTQFTTAYNALLFTYNNAGTVLQGNKLKVYYFKIWDGSQLVRDFIPASYNGTPGMWDKVELKFYGNAGSGTFTLGRQVSGEIPIWVQKNALIKSSSNGVYDYIDTGVNNYTMNNIRCICEMTPLNGEDNAFFGSRGSYYLFYKVSDNYFWPNSKCETIQGTLVVGHKYLVDWNKGTLTVTGDDGVYQKGVRSSTANNTQNLYIFTHNPKDSRTTEAKIHWFKIYIDNVLVRDFVPATMGGRPGLYDKVNHKMYFNANSSGAFTVE